MTESAKTIREQFFSWLSEEIPSEQASELHDVLNILCIDIEKFCAQAGVLKGSLFQTTNLDAVKSVLSFVDSNDVLHFASAEKVGKMQSVLYLYHDFLKEAFLKRDQPVLSPELLYLLADDDMELLRNELLAQNILTLDQFKAINPWKFMNVHALYSISQRQSVYKRISERMQEEEVQLFRLNPDLTSDSVVVTAETEIPVKSDKHFAIPSTKSELVQEVEKAVLKSDLDGITFDELSKALTTTKTAVKNAVEVSRHIVQLNGKLFHDESFVDWEDGANQLEQILSKLLDRNGGYVSAAQLYEYARADMQMFLNDNNMDNSCMVYDMAQHLFEKLNYHGKHLSFQFKSHISLDTLEIASNLD